MSNHTTGTDFTGQTWEFRLSLPSRVAHLAEVRIFLLCKVLITKLRLDSAPAVSALVIIQCSRDTIPFSAPSFSIGEERRC